MKKIFPILLLLAAASLWGGWSAADSEKAMQKLQKYFDNIREDLTANNLKSASDEFQKLESFFGAQRAAAPQGRGRKAIQLALRDARQLSRRAAGGDVVLNKRLEADFLRMTDYFEIYLKMLEKQ